MSQNDELVTKYVKKLQREISKAGQGERTIDLHNSNACFSDIFETKREKTSIQKPTRPMEVQPNLTKKIKYSLRAKTKMNLHELESFYQWFYQWFLITYYLFSF